MEFSEEVFILQVGKFKESDMWVRFLSPTLGVFSAFAFGGSRSKRRFSGCLDIFNRVLVRICKDRRGKYFSLNEGVLLDTSKTLRTSWEKLGITSNCSKFLLAFQVDADGANFAYNLFNKTLNVIETNNTLPNVLPLFFRARLVSENGYGVNVDSCSKCNKTLSDITYFYVAKGVMLCKDCALAQNLSYIKLNKDGLEAFKLAFYGMPDDWVLNNSFFKDKTFAQAIDSFIQYHVGLSWDNGFFRRQ